MKSAMLKLLIGYLLYFDAFLLVKSHNDLKFRCKQCEGLSNSCQSESECFGDFCFISTFRPSGDPIPYVSQGCGRGALANQFSHLCEASNSSDFSVQSCTCRQDFCNAKVNSTAEIVPLLECACDQHDYCTAKRCRGHFCTYVTDANEQKISQGCLNTTKPLLERQLKDVCITPFFLGYWSLNGVELSRHTCTCVEDFCNAAKPEVSEEKLVKCPVGGNFHKTSESKIAISETCTGHRCFIIKLLSDSEQWASGCINFSSIANLTMNGCISTRTGSTTYGLCITREPNGLSLIFNDSLEFLSHKTTWSRSSGIINPIWEFLFCVQICIHYLKI